MKENDSKETVVILEELKNFRFGPIWDGNLNSKQIRDYLVDKGYLERANGFQFLTAKGVTVLNEIGLLNQDTWRLK